MIWKDKYKVGVPLIDEQHQELFRRVTDFVETLRASGEWGLKVEKVNETLTFMQDYVITHFRDEEAYQREIGYPELERHAEIHRQMVEEVVRFGEQYAREGYKEVLVMQFAGKLLAWLINHVAADDQKIAVYARGREGDSV